MDFSVDGNCRIKKARGSNDLPPLPSEAQPPLPPENDGKFIPGNAEAEPGTTPEGDFVRQSVMTTLCKTSSKQRIRELMHASSIETCKIEWVLEDLYVV